MAQKAWVDDLRAPKQYQQGFAEFYKLKFKLTPDVLIPRPETELLVDEVIKLQPKTVIDVGTGSGCIAISVAKNLPEAKVLALDISPAALKIAEKNAELHRVTKRVIFMVNDLVAGIKLAPDVLVTNLPYIPTSRLLFIDPMVKDFEPMLALDGGADGFELYRKLFQQIKNQGIYPKVLIAEIDDFHGSLALQEAKHYFPNAQAEVKKDLTKTDRILVITFN